MKTYYVYAHMRKDKGTIFYIGKGSGERAYFEANRNTFWKRIAKKYGYEVKFLANNLSEKEAYEIEQVFIKSEKAIGNCEANFTNGGDGVRVDKRWWNNKISKSLKGKKRKRGKKNGNFKDIISQEKLEELYLKDGKSTIQIANEVGVSYTTIWTRLRQYNISTRPIGKNKKKIQCINDGKVFESIASAAKFYGVFRENIRKVLKRQYKHTNNLKFKYYE